MTQLNRRPADIVWLQKHLDGQRLAHSLGAELSARELALRWGQDPDRAALAGLLHDCAKGLTNDELLAQARAAGMEPDEIMLNSPQLLHAPVGAVIARRDLGVDDPQVLSAIRWHTVPRRDMSALDIIISVADLIEPTRHYPGVAALRKAAERDLTEAFIAGTACVMRHVLQRGRLLHPDTVWVYNTMKLVQLKKQTGKESQRLGADD